MSDDPIEWLVKEFGAEMLSHEAGAVAWLPSIDRNDWLIEYHSDACEWFIWDRCTSQPLTRADVARLCELFGVEVKRCSGRG